MPNEPAPRPDPLPSGPVPVPLRPARPRAKGSAKVRSHLLGLIYRNSGREFKLPSSAALTKKLKVARSTVNVVIKELRESGYIRGVNGVGVFSNAWSVPPTGPRPLPIVSLLYGDGQLLLYDAFSWSLLGSVGTNVLRRNLALQSLHVAGSCSREEVLDEVNDARCDCLVWFVPWEKASVAKFMRYYQDSGRRLIVVPYDNHDADPAFNSVSFDYYQGGLEFGRRLLAEGRHTLYYLFKDDSHDQRLRGIRDAFAAAGEPLWLRVFSRDAMHDLYANFRECLAARKVPTAIFACGEHVNPVREILREFGIDTREQCRLLAEAHCLDLGDFDGYAMHLLFDQLGEEVANLAVRLVADPQVREKIRVFCPVQAYGAAAEVACALAARPAPAAPAAPAMTGAVAYDDGVIDAADDFAAAAAAAPDDDLEDYADAPGETAAPGPAAGA